MATRTKGILLRRRGHATSTTIEIFSVLLFLEHVLCNAHANWGHAAILITLKNFLMSVQRIAGCLAQKSRRNRRMRKISIQNSLQISRMRQFRRDFCAKQPAILCTVNCQDGFVDCPRPIKSVLPRFHPTWSSRTRPSMGIQRSEGLGSRLQDC